MVIGITTCQNFILFFWGAYRRDPVAHQGTHLGRMKERPRYNVISMRISDEEKEALEQVTRMTRKSVSDLMREAMWLLQGKIDNRDRMAR